MQVLLELKEDRKKIRAAGGKEFFTTVNDIHTFTEQMGNLSDKIFTLYCYLLQRHLSFR